MTVRLRHGFTLFLFFLLLFSFLFLFSFIFSFFLLLFVFLSQNFIPDFTSLKNTFNVYWIVRRSSWRSKTQLYWILVDDHFLWIQYFFIFQTVHINVVYSRSISSNYFLFFCFVFVKFCLIFMLDLISVKNVSNLSNCSERSIMPISNIEICQMFVNNNFEWI